jgi:alpha-amylase
MATKFFTDGAYHAYYNPYESPYEAYINYMNVLSDFGNRLFKLVPETSKDVEIAELVQTLAQKDELVKKYEEEIRLLKSAKEKSVTTTKSLRPPSKSKSKATPTKKETISGKAGKK